MVEKNDTAIIVKNIYKSFSLPHERRGGIKQAIINLFNTKKGYEKQEVINNISFEIKKGEFFGIVGRNGSGKSTLLKLLSGIYVPDKGLVQVNGSLTPFIELGVGFNPELTGRENVFLNGALLGFSRDEMAGMYSDIVEFAELEKFMEQKLKNYSSGMQVRLAFSIAIRADTDILVLDEVLAVGDEAFQRKCNDFFEKIKKDKTKTVILVTHDMESVRKYCSRAILIHDGTITDTGNPEKVADGYILENIENDNNRKDIQDNNKPWINARITGSPVLKNSDKLNVEINYKNIDTGDVYIKVIVQYAGANIMITNAKLNQGIITNDKKQHTVIFSLKLNDYNWGDCQIVTLLVDDKRNINLADYGYNGELKFKIPQTTKVAGIMKTTAKMELVK